MDLRTIEQSPFHQGSTPGPFLFLLFINDIENEVFDNIKMFADNTFLYCAVDNHVAVAESLSEDLDCICQWSNDWCLFY